MEISVNYKFRNNGILVIGGAKPWTESNKKCFGENNSWMEDLIELELASLPETSNFADFMKVLEEQDLEAEKIINQMTLFRKPVDTGRLGEVMESLRGTMQTSSETQQEVVSRLEKAPDKPCRWLKQRLNYACAWSVGFVCGVLTAIKMND